MVRAYHYIRPYNRRPKPRHEMTDEDYMLEAVDLAESELTAQRKLIKEYEKRAKEAQNLYNRLNGDKKARKGRRTWYR